jgi:hypothetical protein
MPNPVHHVWVTQLCMLLASLTTFHCAHAQPNRGEWRGGPSTAFLPTDAGLWGAGGVVSTAAAAMKSGKQEWVTCPAGIQPGNPDFGKGQFSQGVSYGIPMMQVIYLVGFSLHCERYTASKHVVCHVASRCHPAVQVTLPSRLQFAL